MISHAGFCIRDTVRLFRIQLHFISIRTPWLPPFVLCVCADDTSADRTNIKRGRRYSQAARMFTKCRSISSFRTKSRLSHTAWEVRVSVAPDFRLHPSSEIGSHTFCRLGQSKRLRTIPSKILFSSPYQPQKMATTVSSFCGAFFKKRPFPHSSTPAPSPHYRQKNRTGERADAVEGLFHVLGAVFSEDAVAFPVPDSCECLIHLGAYKIWILCGVIV